MFGNLMLIMFLVSVAGLIGVIIWNTSKVNYGSEIIENIIFIVCILLILISLAGGIIHSTNVGIYSSPENYYETLLEKQEIISKLELYDKEIQNVLSGDTKVIDFTKQEEIVKLNSQIEDYNYKIIKHRGYKESFWFSEYYNKDIANLELFEVIFNGKEE